ncbi:hypothetical protein DSO57_1028903 [Entomophthora muscae]|uniref:Uncharacterized protein n=1 Tax=Entomophthora muscae TaxID=34485 RepID=A0ACC2TZZ9_9FUNG|nr:hypothetical protein DSO57_1028903 [Entomophthora muscae]
MQYVMKIQFSLILGYIAAAASRILPECNGQARTRKNLRDMSRPEVNRYFNAIKRLNSGRKPTRWDMYAGIHREQYANIHGTPLFLVWHRMMLYSIEKDLQNIDASVTIPYWDWTSFSQHPRSDPVFSQRLFGGIGNGRTGCVTTGAFTRFPVYFWHSGQESIHCLTRRDDIFRRPFTSATVIDHNYLDLTDIAEFGEAIEGVPHGTVHNNIGGEFAGHASPGDPLFYSHHAFVDKLWFDWQNRHKANYSAYPLNGTEKLIPWNVPIEEVIDPVSSLCYKYPEDHFAYIKPHNSIKLINNAEFLGDAPSTDPTVKLPDPLPEKFISSMGFDVTRIREQERKDALVLAHLGPS